MKKMEDFVEDSNVEIDEEYEFDASQFFDFTKPELDSQIEEVERWFQVSGDYPHSPFIVKLDLDQILQPEGVAKCPKSTKSRKSIKSTSSNNSDVDSRHGVPPSKKITKGKGHFAVEEVAKPKIKQPQKLYKSGSSNFMEPTASHLAKQNTVHDKNQLSKSRSTRLPRVQDKLCRTKSCPVGSVNLGTKRQKLETGFLKKGSHLKHTFSLPHKSSNKKFFDMMHFQWKKATVPTEVELETQLRSQRRRSINTSSSTETKTPKHKAVFKDKLSNTKILQTRSLPRPTKSKAQLTEFQENRLPIGETPTGSPLVEKFSKLSIGSKSNRMSQSERQSSANSKGSSSSRSSRGSFQSEFWEPSQNCGRRVRAHQTSMTRSLDIH